MTLSCVPRANQTGRSFQSWKTSTVSVVALLLMLFVAGCGDDDDDQSPPTSEAPAVTETEKAPTEVTTAPTETEEAEPEPETETETSPEDQPGGAGDEIPAETLALFTGEDGRITPRVVRVPPFIQIRVELRSGDGAEYGLTFEGETIKVGGGLGSVSTTIDGLRTGETVVGTPTGARNRVRIEANAEPGP